MRPTRGATSTLGRGARLGAVTLLALLFLVPLSVAVVAATHPASAFLRGVPVLPGGDLLANGRQVLVRGLPGTPSVPRMLLNSALMAASVTLGKLLIAVPAAFAIGFFRFPGRRLVFWLIFVTLMLPIEVTFFPTYQVSVQLGLFNNFGGLVVPLLASATAVFLFRQVFAAFPLDLVDAARLDGAGPLRFLAEVALPMARPTLAAVAVIEFVYGWNQYLWPLVITSSPSNATIVMGIREQIAAAESFAVPQWNLVMLVALLALIPPVVVVVAMQRWFVRGLVFQAR
jgi:sn-glycerol 3-phosphate transport system permease protein